MCTGLLVIRLPPPSARHPNLVASQRGKERKGWREKERKRKEKRKKPISTVYEIFCFPRVNENKKRREDQREKRIIKRETSTKMWAGKIKEQCTCTSR
jgi:hypothetical protein